MFEVLSQQFRVAITIVVKVCRTGPFFILSFIGLKLRCISLLLNQFISCYFLYTFCILNFPRLLILYSFFGVCIFAPAKNLFLIC